MLRQHLFPEYFKNTIIQTNDFGHFLRTLIQLTFTMYARKTNNSLLKTKSPTTTNFPRHSVWANFQTPFALCTHIICSTKINSHSYTIIHSVLTHWHTDSGGAAHQRVYAICIFIYLCYGTPQPEAKNEHTRRTDTTRLRVRRSASARQLNASYWQD